MITNSQERKAKHQQMIEHLKQFILLKLELIPYDEKASQRLFNEGKTFAASRYIEQDRFLEQVVWILNQLDKTGELFKKQMPDGKFRIYSHFHCYGNTDHWRKCLENECSIDTFTEKCPHFPNITNKDYTPAINCKA